MGVLLPHPTPERHAPQHTQPQHNHTLSNETNNKKTQQQDIQHPQQQQNNKTATTEAMKRNLKTTHTHTHTHTLTSTRYRPLPHTPLPPPPPPATRCPPFLASFPQAPLLSDCSAENFGVRQQQKRKRYSMCKRKLFKNRFARGASPPPLPLLYPLAHTRFPALVMCRGVVPLLRCPLSVFSSPISTRVNPNCFFFWFTHTHTAPLVLQGCLVDSHLVASGGGGEEGEA